MNNTKSYFQFQRIVLRSHKERGGKVQKLYPRTLIDSRDNTKGKSTLISCLFWGMGCDVNFEETWCDDLETLVSFSVSDKNYELHRNNEYISIILKDSKEAYKYEIKYKKVSTEFISKLNEILNFNVLLKYGNNENLSKVPPSYYFAITYIEQMTGWSSFWSCFPNMNAFDKNNRTELIKYICGVLDRNYYDKKHEQNIVSQVKKEVEKEVAINSFYLNHLEAFEKEKYVNTVVDESKKLLELERKTENLRNEYLSKSSLLSSIDNEINIVNIAIGDLEQDYEYSVRNVDLIEVTCPTCGVIHQNDIVNKFSILKDADLLVKRVENLRKEKLSLSVELGNLSEIIHIQEQLLNEIFDKNSFQEHLDNLLLNKGISPRIKEHIIKDKEIIKEKRKLITRLNKEKKDIQTKNQEELESKVIDYFDNLCKELEVSINSKKTFTEILTHTSGGANGIKLMLAVRLTLLYAMYNYAESSIPPFVIDSPRQQDINDYNYSLVLSTFDKIPKDVQFIVAAVETQPISKIKDSFTEIFIESKLLIESEYDYSSKLIHEHNSKLII